MYFILITVRFYLSLLPAGSVPPKIASAISKLTRGVSSGEQSFQTDPSEYPVSKPIPKLKAHQQTSGEAQYTDDIPSPEGKFHYTLLIHQLRYFTRCLCIEYGCCCKDRIY